MAQIVQLLEYRVTPGFDAEVESFLRHATSSGPGPSGVVSRCAGRRLGRDQREHILATIWQSEKDYARGTGERGVPSYLAKKAELLKDVRSSGYSVVSPIDPAWRHARILRVYRASVAGELVEDWQRRAMEPIVRLSGKDGILGVLAGFGIAAAESPYEAPVLAITAWRDWESVLAATGGHLDRLLRETELEDLERPSGVEHYQLARADTD